MNCSPGTSNHKPLATLPSGPGKGEHFLPVTRTSSPINSDIVQNISQMPVRQALAVVIDELGTGLATRGSDLNAVIRRANPALGETDKVFKILASQNRQLAQLADDSQTVLAPLAKERDQISGFVRSANSTSVAAAARAQDESRTFRLFPTFLSRLRPLLADLSVLADKGTPVLQQLGQTAGPLGTEFGELGPFATQARTSLIALGHTAQQSEAPLVSSLPLVRQLKALGLNAKPSASQLLKLLQSLDSTGGYEQLMSLLYNATSVTNGFNSDGHYARAAAAQREHDELLARLRDRRMLVRAGSSTTLRRCGRRPGPRCCNSGSSPRRCTAVDSPTGFASRSPASGHTSTGAGK